MITKNLKILPKSQVEFEITVPWADLQPMWQEAVRKISQEAELPGFRKGQVPTEMVEQRFLNQIQQEFLKQAMPHFLTQALQDTDVIPIDYPQYQIVSFTKGSNLVFRALVTKRPEVKVGNYKALKVKRPPLKEVTDEEVEKIVKDLFTRWQARRTNKSAQTSSGGVGGSIQFNSDPKQPQISEPNDEFAKAIGAQDLADLKARIKRDLEEEAKNNNELDFEEAILEEVAKITTVDLPEVLIQDELNRMLVNLQRRVADYGLLMDDYLKGQGKTLEQLRKEWRPQAEKNVLMELGLAEIARLENVDVTDEEVQAEIDKIQDQRLKVQFEAQEPRLHLKHALRQARTLNLLKTLVSSN